jgi:HK97 family phage prohead protease
MTIAPPRHAATPDRIHSRLRWRAKLAGATVLVFTTFPQGIVMLAPTIESVFRPRTTIDRDGVVEGYASLFGEIDQARDMVMPGAFTRTLATRSVRRIPMLFQHDPAEPIGIWFDLHEDHLGLKARGKLIPDVQRSREVFALVRDGAIDGLSIGFRTVKGRVDPRSRVRKLDQVELWEISIVTFPLLAGARVRAAKAASRPSFARTRAERAWERVVRGGVTFEARPPRRRFGRST